MSLIRLAFGSALVLALTACGGSGGGLGGILGPITGTTIQCDPGTQVQLANPQPGQTGVSPNIGQITIVANSNNNTLYTTYGQWYLVLNDQNGTQIQGSNLSLVPRNGNPQPYTSDFYYASNLSQQLPAGSTWTVQLYEQNANACTPVPLQSFST